MGSLQRVRQVEKNKRLTFLGTGVAGAAVSLLMSVWLGAPILCLSAYLGWEWLKFRAKNGLRF